jgi:hypothetical protein
MPKVILQPRVSGCIAVCTPLSAELSAVVSAGAWGSRSRVVDEMLKIVCLSSGLDDLMTQVKKTYDHFHGHINLLQASGARFLQDAGNVKADAQSLALEPATQTAGAIFAPCVDHVIGILSVQLSALTKCSQQMKESFAAFQSASATWGPQGALLTTALNSALSGVQAAMQPLARGCKMTFGIQSKIARNTKTVRRIVPEAMAFIENRLAEASRQCACVADHMRALHRDLMPGSALPAVVIVDGPPMAAELRALMGRELDMARLFEASAIRVLLAVLPGMGNSHSLVNYFSMDNCCNNPIVMTIRRQTAVRPVGRANDKPCVLKQGQIVTMLDGGYGVLWKCAVKDVGQFWIDSRSLLL